jgi:hypothetical protein
VFRGACVLDVFKQVIELLRLSNRINFSFTLAYCFQTARFAINENFGCFTSTFPSNAATVILYGPTLLLSVATLVYGCEPNFLFSQIFVLKPIVLALALYHLAENHIANVKFLAPYLVSRDSAMSGRQYYRLMAMSMVLGVWGIIWISLDIKYIASYGSFPLPSWDEIHADISEIVEVPTILLGPYNVYESRLLWWGVPGAALLFFFLFGTSYEVLAEYLKFGKWVRSKVFKRPVQIDGVVSTYVFFCSSSAIRFFFD